ncbi:helix-turn-helix transcriptional regulator [Azospirillum thermophilum]|uniref:helix-turn-helix transcriptional regulator n=1 Tax=Azospirillum thermophilum TaxID=2202148 RepID=UPI001FECAF10|nr:AraC family transcriptional regulator [Azospirillum thermophilum]
MLSLCRALLDDPARDETLEDWAERAGASGRTLARLFLKETGLTFGAWRQQARLAEAVARLALGEPVARVALAAGYDSASAFTAMFRRTLGATPRDYFATEGREEVGREALRSVS